MAMNLQLHYRPYRPSGYTDDLGIIADRNQWVNEQLAGWYVFANIDIIVPMIKWMVEVGVDFKIKNNWIIVPKDEDAAMVKLRWG